MPNITNVGNGYIISGHFVNQDEEIVLKDTISGLLFQLYYKTGFVRLHSESGPTQSSKITTGNVLNSYRLRHFGNQD